MRANRGALVVYKKNKIINDYFERKLEEEFQELDRRMYKRKLIIAEEHNERGILNSGIFASALFQMIIDELFDACKVSLNLIDTFQETNNLSFSDKQLRKISLLYSSRYKMKFKENIRNNLESSTKYVNESTFIKLFTKRIQALRLQSGL